MYIFKSHPINVTNLVIALMHWTIGDRLYNPCTISLVDSKFFETQYGQFSINHCPLENSQSNFRHINWESNIDSLKIDFDKAKALGRCIIFGNHHDNQIKILKEYFQEDVYTISINYNESDYPMLLSDIAEHHVHLLYNKRIPLSETDHMLTRTKSKPELIAYYTKAFDEMALIPKESVSDCDYNIDVSDFFNRGAMIQHFENINLPMTPNALALYDQWRNAV